MDLPKELRLSVYDCLLPSPVVKFPLRSTAHHQQGPVSVRENIKSIKDYENFETILPLLHTSSAIRGEALRYLLSKRLSIRAIDICQFIQGPFDHIFPHFKRVVVTSFNFYETSYFHALPQANWPIWKEYVRSLMQSLPTMTELEILVTADKSGTERMQELLRKNIDTSVDLMVYTLLREKSMNQFKPAGRPIVVKFKCPVEPICCAVRDRQLASPMWRKLYPLTCKMGSNNRCIIAEKTNLVLERLGREITARVSGATSM
jgi:hypothetical protein